MRIVRRFRPQVIVSVFSGTPRDGHGQHQAAGWAAREAFAAAADSTRFPELEQEEGLRAWTALKLYRSTRFDTAATTLTLDGGVLDPAVGKSFHQIAMASRSLHRSQDMGRLQALGPSLVRLELLEDRTAEGGGGLFAGIDTSFSAMPWRSAPDVDKEAPRRFAARVDSARRAIGPLGLERVAELLARARNDLEPLKADSRARVLFWTPEQTDQRAHLDIAGAIAEGLLGDAVSEDARVIGDQRVPVAIETWNTGARPLSVGVAVRAVSGWSVEGDTLAAGTLKPGELRAGDDDSACRRPAASRRPTSCGGRCARRCTTGARPRRGSGASRSKPAPAALLVAMESGWPPHARGDVPGAWTRPSARCGGRSPSCPAWM